MDLKEEDLRELKNIIEAETCNGWHNRKTFETPTKVIINAVFEKVVKFIKKRI